MSARAPAAIERLWADIDLLIPQAKLGGIVGDVKHSFGYHLARRDLPRSDYSVKLSRDLGGKSDCASALDITLPSDLMQTCTRRLHAAAVNRDPRLRALREFCGTLDGRRTYPWDLASNSSEGIGSWDDSHLWHIHLSFYRLYADDYDALAPIASVLAGKPIAGSDLKEFTMNADDEKKIAAIIDSRLDDIANAVWGKQFARPDQPKTKWTAAGFLTSSYQEVQWIRLLADKIKSKLGA